MRSARNANAETAMSIVNNVPHGYCEVCLGLLPVELQDSGGRFCSRVCEHVVSACGPLKEGECIVCGADTSQRNRGSYCCCEACKIHLQKLHSRWSCRMRGAGLRVCDFCGKPSKRQQYCSPACKIAASKGRKVNGVCEGYAAYDGFTPTASQYDELFDGCVRMGIFTPELEAELAIAESAMLCGHADPVMRSLIHTEGPFGMVGMRNLGLERKNRER